MNTSKKRYPIHSELIVAFAAITISIATLFVYVYQSRIMQRQVMLSAWPYIEFLPSWGPGEGYYLEIVNKGIGPAIVKQVNISLDGKRVEDLFEVFSILKDSSFGDFGYSTIEGRVIAPGEKIRAFTIEDYDIAVEIKDKLKEHHFKYEICYCSVYDECWKSTGIKVFKEHCK